MTRTVTRTGTCDRGDAEVRIAQAIKFLEVAELVAGAAAAEKDYSSVAASLAVLSGIAASDAASCVALGRRSRSLNHHDAEQLISQIVPGGPTAAANLRRLLNLKDEAQYGVIHVSGQDLRSALRRAEQLVVFARAVLKR